MTSLEKKAALVEIRKAREAFNKEEAETVLCRNKSFEFIKEEIVSHIVRGFEEISSTSVPTCERR